MAESSEKMPPYPAFLLMIFRCRTKWNNLLFGFTPVLCTSCVLFRQRSLYICLICVLVWSIIRVSCTVSGPSIIMSTSCLRRHWLIPVLQNFRQRFFGLSVSDLDIWSKCKLYCVPSLRSIIAGWDILFSVFCFSIYFLKAWVGFLVIIMARTQDFTPFTPELLP